MTRWNNELQHVRSFSRSFVKQLGLLDKFPYHSSLNLLESRIIFELHRNGAMLAKELVSELTIDKGYLSRTLSVLERKGTVQMKPNPFDAREKSITLTTMGILMFEKINEASLARTGKLLEDLGKTKAAIFTHNLSVAEAVLNGIPSEHITLRELQPGDLGWIIGKHGELYHKEHGWNQEFEVLVADIALEFVKKHNPECERAWIAEAQGLRLGCIFLVRENAETAKLRILLVDPIARGLGIGSLLVKECVSFARKAGYSRLTLWTNNNLASARKIYQAEGFVLVKEEPHHSFGKDLVGQYWEKNLCDN